MIVAIYLENLSIVLPVNPVNRIERLTPQDRRQDRHGSNRNQSFAALLDAMRNVEDPEDLCVFDSLA